MDEFLNKTRKAMLENNSLFEDYAYKYIIEDIMFKTGRIYNGLNNDIKQPSSEKCPLVPGNIYTFKYTSSRDMSKPDEQSSSNYDTLPVVMCTSVEQDKIKGINLNLCSRSLKTGIINELQNIDSEWFYEKANRTGVMRGSPNIIKLFLSSEMTSKFIQVVESKYQVTSQEIILRSYLIEGIKFLKVIDLELWKYVPFLSWKSTLRTDTLKSIMSKVQNQDKRV